MPLSLELRARRGAGRLELLLLCVLLLCPSLRGRVDPQNAVHAALTRQRAVRVKELTDADFEHDTQAATGQTTGRWLVAFVGDELSDSELNRTIEEGTGAVPEGEPAKPVRKERRQLASIDILHTMMLIASEQVPREFIPAVVHVNKNPALKERFEINSTPVVLLFRDRKVFPFPGIPSSKFELHHFLQEGFAVFGGQDVPTLPTPFDNVQRQLDSFKKQVLENPWPFAILGAAVTLVFFTVAMLAALRRPASTVPREVGKQD